MYKRQVAHIGEDLKKKPGFDLKEGDKIVSLVSLSMTPLKIEKILAIHKDIDRVDIVGKAILFESCLLYTSGVQHPDGGAAPAGAVFRRCAGHRGLRDIQRYGTCLLYTSRCV